MSKICKVGPKSLTPFGKKDVGFFLFFNVPHFVLFTFPHPSRWCPLFPLFFGVVLPFPSLLLLSLLVLGLALRLAFLLAWDWPFRRKADPEPEKTPSQEMAARLSKRLRKANSKTRKGGQTRPQEARATPRPGRKAKPDPKKQGQPQDQEGKAKPDPKKPKPRRKAPPRDTPETLR